MAGECGVTGKESRTDRAMKCFAFVAKNLEKNGKTYSKASCKACSNEWFKKCYTNGTCGTKVCPFFKTKKQHEADVIRAAELLERNLEEGDKE